MIFKKTLPEDFEKAYRSWPMSLLKGIASSMSLPTSAQILGIWFLGPLRTPEGKSPLSLVEEQSGAPMNENARYKSKVICFKSLDGKVYSLITPLPKEPTQSKQGEKNS
jgi:hypothetical protein